jgi:hypothetical protein
MFCTKTQTQLFTEAAAPPLFPPNRYWYYWPNTTELPRQPYYIFYYDIALEIQPRSRFEGSTENIIKH